MKHKSSSELFAEAKTLMPGGVSSPVRAIKPYPFYTASASGAHLTTVDGTTLIDCCMAYGPLILGHAHPDDPGRRHEPRWRAGGSTAPLLRSNRNSHGWSRAITPAWTWSGSFRAARKRRWPRSGSPAGFTGKKDIVKIEGGFHGAHDAVLVKAGSGATTMGVPDSAGVLADLVAHTRQVPYNDPEALESLLSAHKDVAALIIEPVLGNIGPILPKDHYLRDIREITRAHEVLLILMR